MIFRRPRLDVARPICVLVHVSAPKGNGGAMKYMLFTYRDPSFQLDPEERAAVPAAVAAWCEEMDDRGVRLEGHVLASLEESRTIRIRDGELTVEEGPVAEPTAHVAGFNILECAGLDEALELAAKNPGAKFGILELRPMEP
jgi:hypothetical protein